MKQITIIVFTLISFSFQSNNSYPNDAQDDINLICSGKWHLEYMKVLGEKIPLTPAMIENSWVIYFSDGRAVGMDIEGLPTIGKWEYLKEIRALKVTDEEETDIQKIISISESEFVVSTTQHEHEYIIGFSKKKNEN